MAKVSKADANYRDATGSHNCGNCAHMNSDGTCTKVIGQVSRRYVSRFWTAKPSGARRNPQRRQTIRR